MQSHVLTACNRIFLHTVSSWLGLARKTLVGIVRRESQRDPTTQSPQYRRSIPPWRSFYLQSIRLYLAMHSSRLLPHRCGTDSERRERVCRYRRVARQLRASRLNTHPRPSCKTTRHHSTPWPCSNVAWVIAQCCSCRMDWKIHPQLRPTLFVLHCLQGNCL